MSRSTRIARFDNDDITLVSFGLGLVNGCSNARCVHDEFMDFPCLVHTLEVSVDCLVRLRAVATEPFIIPPSLYVRVECGVCFFFGGAGVDVIAVPMVYNKDVDCRHCASPLVW